MAEIAPWLQPQANVAPWLNKEPEVSVAEDVLTRALPTGAVKGVTSVAGTPGDLQELVKLADEKGYNPMGWLAEKVGATDLGKFLKGESEKTAKGPLAKGVAASGDMMGGGNIELPSSKTIQKAVEDNVTGPLPDAKTAIGRGVQTSMEVAPALAMGPVGGVRGLLAKSAGAGAASELAGQGVAAVEHKLPESVQPWAQPVARAAGTMAGTFTPAGARKIVTPLPMADDQYAAVQRLHQTNPELVESSTAGQLTERPRLMAMEARSPRGRGAEVAQEEAFTRGVTRQAGIEGDMSPANLVRGQGIGAEIGDIRQGGNIPDPEFTQFVRGALNERRNLQRTAGRNNTPQMDEVVNALRFGAAQNGQPVFSMPGGRYNYMRGDLERQAQAAANPEERLAIGRVRDQMDEAFRRSLPSDVAATLAERENQYANYNVLRNVPPRTGRATVTPQEVKSAVGHQWGNPAANEGRGTLVPLADDAARVMTPHPTPRTEIPPSVDLLVSALSSLAHGGAGHAVGGGLHGALLAGTEGGVFGHLIAPSLYNGAANMASRVVSNGPAQGYLGNQVWRPGAASTTDRDQLIRLLMSPEAKPQ